MRQPTLALATTLLVLVGCVPVTEPPPKAPDHEPLIIGKSPPSSPLATSPTKEASLSEDDTGRVARGNAPAIWLPSLTTPGKVTLPPNKVVIVIFWATWCEPCKKAFPKLQELYAKYKGRGLEIAAISVDDESNGIAAFAKTHGARFPVGWDENKDIANAYKPAMMPTTLIVDRKGNVAHTHGGYHDGEDRELERELSALL